MNHHQTQDSQISAYGALVSSHESAVWSASFACVASLLQRVKAALTDQPSRGLYGCMVGV